MDQQSASSSEWSVTCQWHRADSGDPEAVFHSARFTTTMDDRADAA